MKLITTNDLINENMQYPEFKRSFEAAGEQYQAADQIATLRKKLGWSRSQLARKSGVSKATIAQIERGDMEITDKSAKILEQVTGSLGQTIDLSIA